MQRRKYSLIKQPVTTVAGLDDVTITAAAAGDVLVNNGSVWVDATVSQMLDYLGTEAQGDIIYRGASGWALLPAGTSGQFLKTLGAGANPTWDTVSGSVATDAIWDAKGDLAVGTGANTASKLTLGTDGYVLTADSAQATGVKWAAAGGVSDGDKGDISVSSSGAVWTIDNDVVTYAKMQNVSATSRILGRKTAAAGDVEECTLSEVLDMVGSAAQGDILYRGASGWTRLGAGTNGHFLKTQGAGADPVWAAASGSGSVATDAIWDAKGDLAVGTGADTAAKLTAGTNGQVLQADSGESSGLKWVDHPGRAALLAAEITADSPMAYWKCDETSGTTLDNAQGTAAYDLTLSGTYTLSYTYLLPGDTTKYLALLGTAAYAGVSGSLGFTPPINGDWTVECVILPKNYTANGNRIFAIAGVGETEATNYQMYVFTNTDGTLGAFWEHSAGTNVSIASGVNIRRGEAVHLAFTKDGTGNTVTFFINGRKVGIVSYANEPTGGSGSMLTRIGNDGTGSSDPMTIGHVAVYNSVLSDARIRAHALAAGLH